MMGGFLSDVAVRAAELDRECPPFTDPRAGRDELQRRVGRISKAIGEADWLETRRQLLTLMAHGCRFARDFSIETEAAAVARDDAELGGK